MKARVYVSALVLGVVIAACGGGGGGGITPNAPSGVQPQAGKAILSITIPAAPTGQAQSRKYISSGTESVVIMQGTTNLGTFNTTPSSPGCGQTQAGLTCSFSIAPTVGANQVFTITAYQFQNAGGAVLSSGTATVTVNANANTNIAISMGGTPASLAFVFPSVPAGTATSAPFNVVAKDASGATIVGAAAFAAPIALNVAANGSIVALSVNGGAAGSSIAINTPNDVPNIVYNGHNLGFASISATSGALSTTAYFGPTPTIVAQTVTSLPSNWNFRCCHGAGPDPNGAFLWPIQDQNGQFAIGKLSSGGTFAEEGAGSIPGDIQGVIPTGPGGKTWFSQYGTTPMTLGSVDPTTGAVTIETDTNASSPYAYAISRGAGTWVYVVACCWTTYAFDTSVGTSSANGLLQGFFDPGPVVIGNNAYSINSAQVLAQYPIQGTSPNLSFGTTNLAGFQKAVFSQGLTAASDGTMWAVNGCSFSHVSVASPFSTTSALTYTMPTTLCDPTVVVNREARRAKASGIGGLFGPVLLAPDSSVWGLGANGFIAGMPGGATVANVGYSTATFPLVNAAGGTVPFSANSWGFAADGNILVEGEPCCSTPQSVFIVEIAY